jgi:hypothetical protein
MALGQQEKIFTGTGQASVEEIEEHNIVGATCLAMARAMKMASEASGGLWQPDAEIFPRII